MTPTPEEIRATVEAAVAALSEEELDRELAARAEIPDELTFIEACEIEDKETGRLVPFTLWPAQREILPLLSAPRLFVLKARQLGLSWLDPCPLALRDHLLGQPFDPDRPPDPR